MHLARKWHELSAASTKTTDDYMDVGARVHPCLKLVAELVDDRAHGPVGAIGQPTDRGARHDAHRSGDLQQQVQVLARALAPLDSAEQLVRPSRAFTARRTFINF